MSEQRQAKSHRELSPADIKVRLIRRGLTVSDLAKAIGYPRPTVSVCINRGRFPLCRRKILNYLNQ